MQTHERIEALPLHELPERVAGPLRDWLHHREQMRGQRGIIRVETDRIEVTYRIFVRDEYELVGSADAGIVEFDGPWVGRPVRILPDDPNGC